MALVMDPDNRQFSLRTDLDTKKGSKVKEGEQSTKDVFLAGLSLDHLSPANRFRRELGFLRMLYVSTPWREAAPIKAL